MPLKVTDKPAFSDMLSPIIGFRGCPGQVVPPSLFVVLKIVSPLCLQTSRRSFGLGLLEWVFDSV